MAGFARLLGRPHETYTAAAEKARLGFDRFWNPERGDCFDVSDGPEGNEPAYIGHYRGDRRNRDAAYHQGTVWGWLIGPFVSAHLRVYQDPAQARSFLAPFFHHLSEAGLGSLSEIFDGDPPFTPEGCFAQAWSVAEVLRVLDEIANFNENRLTLKK